MHYLITGGKHPFYDYSDNIDSFKKKLSGLKKVDPDPSFSWVAKNLFQRMTMISAHMRYTARDALCHPWITRRKFDKIPESFMEKMSNIQVEQNLKSGISALHFASLVKGAEFNFDSKQFREYKAKIKLVSNKIEKWHNTLIQSENAYF